MPDTITTLLVVDEGGPTPLAGTGGIEVLRRSTGAVDSPPESVDCVVDATDDPAPAVDADVPVVAFTDAGPELAARPEYDAYVRRDDGGRLPDAVRWAVARANRADPAPVSADGGSTGTVRRADGNGDPGDDGTGDSRDDGAGGDPDPDRTGGDPDADARDVDEGPDDGPGRTGDGAGFAAPDGDHHRRLLESMADGVLVTDWNGTMAYVNAAAEDALGMDRDRLVGEHVSVLAEAGVVAADDIERIQGFADGLQSGEGMATYQMELTPGDGPPRTIELRIVPTPEGTGVDGALVTVRDVTRRRETERALRTSRKRVTRLHEAATAIVACRNEDQLYRQAIDAAEQVLEFDISSIVIDDGERLVPKAVSSGSPPGGARSYDYDEGLVGKTFRTGESYVVEDAHADEASEPAKDEYRSGISVPVGDHGVFQAVSTERGAFDENDLELAELLMAHVTETLTRIRVEQRLRDRETELVEERDRLAALFENVPDPCVDFDFEDGDPIVRDVNQAFEEVFGLDREELVGENIDEYIIPEGYDDEAQEMNETLQAGERLQTTSKRLADGEVRDFLLHVVPFKVGERTLQGYAIYTDITDQKERERKLRQQNEQLDQFASMVSHDLRNPLNLAEGYLNAARETGDEDAFEQVRAAHERMNRMIDELLALARRGEVVGETRPTELSEVAAGAWETVDTGLASFEVEGGTVLEADPKRLAELLENLFRNAVEHAGPDVTVRVGALDDGFFVADDGPGIDEDERDRVFDAGYTTSADGTGFGLSIVQQIAAGHDWSVEVTESADGGARFEFRAADGESIPNPSTSPPR